MRPAVLYVSYDGMLEPLGQSQVIAYLEKLSGTYAIHLVSFEKPRDLAKRDVLEAMKRRLQIAGIRWVPLTYHKSPSALATAWDAAVGMAVIAYLSVREKVSILHARSYVPALMILPARWLSGAKFLFDIRGFWADERVDGGLWPRNGLLYRLTKRLERRFFRSADHVVTLTKASRDIIGDFDYLQAAMPAISVIPTCVDLARFRPGSVVPPEPFTFGYVGQIGTWYLFEETIGFFAELRRLDPDARFLIINRHEHGLIRDLAVKHGIDLSAIVVTGAEHHDVPGHVRKMHAAAALIKPCYSKLASAPTKLAEYLACGVPCLGNAGVGDMEEILGGKRVGIVLHSFSSEDRTRAAQDLIAMARDPHVRERCRSVAEEDFSLEGGVEQYRVIYESLLDARTALHAA